MAHFHLDDPSLWADKNFVDGEWCASVSQQTFSVSDPATNRIIGACPESTVQDVLAAINHADSSLKGWRQKSGRERSKVLRRWYNLVVENRNDLAMIISFENGKAHQDAIGEVMLGASFLEWFAEEAARIYGEVVPHSSSVFRVEVIKEPIGVCGMITPWNFPIAMITRKVGACLAAGCTAVVKPDGLTPFSAAALGILAQRAGIPAGVLNIINALDNTPLIGKAMCESTIIKKISFTGSTRVGKILLAQSAPNIQKLSLELGGNAPFIVFDDADLDIAVNSLIASKFKVSGQTCVCANRIFVQDGIHDAFVERLVSAVSRFQLGPGLDKNNTHGPLINKAAIQKSKAHVEDAIEKGAKVLIGHTVSDIKGSGSSSSIWPLSDDYIDSNFFPPTVLINANNSMLVFHEETFGPVAAIFRFKTEAEVIAASNESEVGLASYVITQGHERARRISENLSVGMVAINTGIISDAAAPFGGVKHSGFGREGSRHGIEEYLQLKTIVTGNIRSLL